MDAYGAQWKAGNEKYYIKSFTMAYTSNADKSGIAEYRENNATKVCSILFIVL
jgi:hypothetical protein